MKQSPISTRSASLATIALLGLCCTLAIAEVPAIKSTQSLPRPADMHDVRYCEVLPVFRDGVTLKIEVYNTITLNDCPADKWGRLSSDVLAKQFDATHVKLNGPRYWVMNRIEGSGDTASGKVADFGGIQMRQVATLSMKLWQIIAGERPYEEMIVQRSTVWVYEKGTKVYELISPQGDVYVMQSYAQIVDPKLNLQNLDLLQARLKLPKGWSYRTRVLQQELGLKADGKAHVIQDDFQNTYQKASRL
jgi:hypothetical protein